MSPPFGKGNQADVNHLTRPLSAHPHLCSKSRTFESIHTAVLAVGWPPLLLTTKARDETNSTIASSDRAAIANWADTVGDRVQAKETL